MGTKKGESQLRLNYYPKISEDFEIKQDQIRCGEHTDYGGVSILFQDDCGGLEVQLSVYFQLFFWERLYKVLEVTGMI